MQQSVNFARVIPIKKRRFPVIESASPSSKENPSVPEINKQEPHIFTAATDTSDLSKLSAQIITDTSLEYYEYNPKKAESAICSELTDDLKNKVDLPPAEEYANQASSMGARAMIVKQEIPSERIEGTRQLELSAGAQNVELPLEQKQPLLHALELQNRENDCGKSVKSNPFLLSLVVSEEKLDMCDNNDVAAKNVGSQLRAIRSNWDLNTSMEEWEGSTNSDAKTTASMVGLSLNKQGHTLRERSSNSCIASLLPNPQKEPDDSLRLSLAVPFRELDAVRKQSFLYKKSESTNVTPNPNMQNTNLNFLSFRTVKLEPISEVSKSEFSIKSSCSGMGLSNSSSVEQELVKKRNSKAVYPLSVSPRKLVEHRSIKSELTHECNQESTASSSATTVSMTPQNSCSSKSSTCTELNISGDQHGFSFHSEEALTSMNKLNDQVTGGTLSKTFNLGGLCNAGNLTVEDSEKLELTHIDGRPSELVGKIGLAANDEEKTNPSTEMFEEDTIGSDFESYENQRTPQKVYNKEEREYEEGEVRTPLQHSAREDHVVDAKSNDVKLVACDLRNLQPFVLSGDQSTNTSDYDGKSIISENHDETYVDHVKEHVISGYEPTIEENSSQKLSDNAPEIKVDEKRSISATIEKRVDLSRQDAEKCNGEEVTSERPTNRSHGSGTGYVDKETDSTLSMVEASNGNDAIRDSDNVGNKSRIINLPRATVDTSYRTRSIPNRVFSPGSGKERYSDFDGDIQPRWNRNETYTDKFAKGRAREPSFRNSRPNFMRGRGRGAGRFGPSRNDWDSDNNFASETYNGPSGYPGRKHKHTSSIDGDVEHSGYRRKFMNDDKFMRHSSNDTIDPVYNRPQTMFDEFDGQVIREKRIFSANHQKGYPRISSKSPVRYQNHRRSPNEIEELNQRRSPPPFRMRRMRSPDRASYREEIVSRRRGSPSFVTRHSDSIRDVDSVPEHVRSRSFNSNRRSPPARVFPRRDVFDSRKRRDVSVEERREFIERRGGGPPHSFRPSYNGDSDDFHFRPNDGPRPYRFCPDGDAEFSERSNVRESEFSERSNVREREFAERSNMQEREFDGRIKHQPLVASRRIRDIEEQQDGNYRHGGRVWHDDGFNNVSEMKRRKF